MTEIRVLDASRRIEVENFLRYRFERELELPQDNLSMFSAIDNRYKTQEHSAYYNPSMVGVLAGILHSPNMGAVALAWLKSILSLSKNAPPLKRVFETTYEIVAFNVAARVPEADRKVIMCDLFNKAVSDAVGKGAMRVEIDVSQESEESELVKFCVAWNEDNPENKGTMKHIGDIFVLDMSSMSDGPYPDGGG